MVGHCSRRGTSTSRLSPGRPTCRSVPVVSDLEGRPDMIWGRCLHAEVVANTAAARWVNKHPVPLGGLSLVPHYGPLSVPALAQA